MKSDLEERMRLRNDCSKAICMLKKEMPPSFFDVMSHLSLHLVEEIYLCGLVHTRWMYPFERYYKSLKGYVKNLAKPKGSISQGYQLEEALGYITEYMTGYSVFDCQAWDMKQDSIMVDGILEGKGKPRKSREELQGLLHNFVMDQSSELDTYPRQYKLVYDTKELVRQRF